MWMQSENIVHRLFSRQLSSGRPNTNIHRARGLYENVVPSHTVYEVDCPDQWWRRFTNDGQYLICFCKTYQDLLVYRPLWPSYSSALDRPDLPNKFHKFESYFQLLHQVPLARAVNEVICKDFFLQTDNNLYGIFATSTAPDPNGAAIHGAVPGVPCIEKITFLVVRFADGVVTGRSVFKDDYIHLAHNAGAFLHEDLLAVLSIRFQRIHILQVREGGLFLDVRTIGDFCREDDELLLNSQAQAESQFQEEQRLQRKARGRAQEDEALASPSKARMLKPWTIIDRKRPRYRDSRALRDDLGTHAPYLTSEGGNGDEIDVLYDGYFRGLFTPGRGAPVALPNGTSNRSHGEHAHVRRFRVGAAVDSLASLSNGTNSHVVRPGDQETGSHASLHGRQRFEHYNYEISSGRRFAIPVGHEGLPPQPSSSAAGRDSLETSNSGRRYGGTTGLSSSGSLYSSGGSDSASYSNNSSDATALHEYSSHHVMRHEAGPSERWARRPPIVAPPSRNRDRDRSEFRDELMSLGEGPSRGSAEVGDIQQTTLSTGGSGGRSGRLGTNLGDSGVPYVPVHVGGHGSVWGGGGGGAQPGNAAAAAAAAATAAAATTSANGSDGAPNGGQMLRGLKQRLLSFILQGIKNDDTTPANRAQRLKRFYYHFHQYVDLVMWKVQFLDRYHLLIKFGSADGVVLRNSEASSQNAFLAVYNTETTEILGFYQNSSEELLQLVERYWDHFRVAPQYPSYMSFISSYANNSFAREQFRKEKDACLAGKIGSYTQVIKRTLASLPYNSQSQSPSAYFDQYLFHYDEKLISSTDRHKPCAEHPIKFISRRRPNTLKFKINPGLEHGSNDGHVKRVASFLFHPIFPFAISVQQSFMQTSIVNFHFRR